MPEEEGGRKVSGRGKAGAGGEVTGKCNGTTTYPLLSKTYLHIYLHNDIETYYILF